MKFGEKLIRAGLIDVEQRDEALMHGSQKGLPIGEALYDLKYISEDKLLHSLAREFGTKFVPSDKLQSILVPESVLERFPYELVERCLVFPILVGKDQKSVGIVFAGTRDDAVIEEIRETSGFAHVQSFVARRDSIMALIKRHYKAEVERQVVPEDVGEEEFPETYSTVTLDRLEKPAVQPTGPVPRAKTPSSSVPRARTPSASVPAASTRTPSAPVHAAAPAPRPRVDSGSIQTVGSAGRPAVDAVLTKLVKIGASDLHLSAGLSPKMRRDGDIKSMPGWIDPVSSDRVDAWVREVAPEHVQQLFDETGDGDFAYEVPGLARFRVNWFRGMRGVSAVMRTIPSKVPTLNELGFPPTIKAFCDLPKGLVVVTGPTGSGKSTTLAAMVDYINKSKALHIVTIEDPVEFVHQSERCLVNQREVHTHTTSFSKALRAALREDPDIVLVGEMRDLETVHIAIETAETGHLVFGTLHTTTAHTTVDRIIDQFPNDQQAQIRVMLAESLRGVISQTLCKRISGGRVASLEILMVNAAIANLIREGKTFQIPSIMQTSRGSGMQTQAASMLQLVTSGTITPDEAVAKSVDQQNMRAILEKADFPARVG